MIRAADIQENLLHLIGWEQHYDTVDLKLASSLLKSESGLYFQQIHPLLTLQNLSSIAPDFRTVSPAFYEASLSYDKGTIVMHNGLLYKAVRPISKGEEPKKDAEDPWSETTLFSEWLESKIKASIQKAIARYCNEKAAQGTYQALCENKILFEGTGRIVDTIKNQKNLVGFEIIPIRSKGVTTKINKIGLQFTEPGEYTIYIMHSSLSEPFKSIKLTKTQKNSLEWFSFTDLYLPYQGKTTDAGGSWYLCYLQEELPANSKAIRKNKDWSKEPCGTCSRRELLSWTAWSKYLEVHPFFVNSELVNSAQQSLELWDIAHNQYIYDTNYGLNLEISVECDITDFIIEQRSLFQDIIAKQVAIDLLKELAYNANARANRHVINASRVDILYEIDGDSSSMKKSGLAYELDLAFKAISLNTSGIDRVCLPCKNNGIKYRVV